MARRRYLSTEISLDARVNELACGEDGDFAALLYTWLIPHADDAGGIDVSQPAELLFRVMPGRRDVDVDRLWTAIGRMIELRLVLWTEEEGRLGFPLDAFYRQQTYIPASKRKAAGQRHTEKRRSTPLFPDERRATPNNAASPSPSPSPSFTTTADLSGDNPNPPDPEAARRLQALEASFNGTGHARRSARPIKEVAR